MVISRKPIRRAVVGLQWGDEGKGKIVDEFVTEALERNDGKRVVVARYQGGSNAGHTIYVRSASGDLTKFVTHSAPSGLTSGADVAIGPQVAFNPLAFAQELQDAEKTFGYSGRVLVSERTGVLFQYHKDIDLARETGGNGVGSTKQGIGPFYEDNANRVTRIHFADYVSDKFPERLRKVLDLKRRQLEELSLWKDDLADSILAEHEVPRRILRENSVNLEYRMRDYFAGGNHIIIEGAQGTGLDVDMGTLPDITSSHLLAPHAFPSLGLSRKDFEIWGVEKVYPTRVGKGDLPTLANDDFASVAEMAGEMGATTGRRRRVGYPDWLFIRRAVALNDCDAIALTRVDNVQDRNLKVCFAYQVNGFQTVEVPMNLDGVEPVYGRETYSWNLWEGPKDLSDALRVDSELKEKRKALVSSGFNGLPDRLKEFVRSHDAFVGSKTKGVSIGPGRGETIYLE